MYLYLQEVYLMMPLLKPRKLIEEVGTVLVG